MVRTNGPCEIRLLDEGALRRFEALCETWAKIAEGEIARRKCPAAYRPLEVYRSPIAAAETRGIQNRSGRNNA